MRVYFLVKSREELSVFTIVLFTHIHMFKFGGIPHDGNFVVECLYQDCPVCRPAISDLVRLRLLPASIQELLLGTHPFLH